MDKECIADLKDPVSLAAKLKESRDYMLETDSLKAKSKHGDFWRNYKKDDLNYVKLGPMISLMYPDQHLDMEKLRKETVVN